MLKLFRIMQYCLGLIALTQLISPPLVKAEPAQSYQIKGISKTINGRQLIIPDFENMPLQLLHQQRKQFKPQISRFQQLKDAPVSRLNLPKSSFIPSPLAVVDNYWSDSEQTNPNIPLNYYVSGSVTCSGRNKVVAPKPGQSLSYLELTNGQRWMSGKQLVSGGCGILKSFNGGKEPAGRLVYGTDALKIVLTGVDETTQSASFSAYMRFCVNLPVGRSCTPYFIPIPWFPISGNNLIAIGGGLVR